MRGKKRFNVIMLNHLGEIVHYDIMPHLLEAYRKLKPARRPKSYKALIEFIDRWAAYHYWSRCEWEFLMESWPPCEKYSPHKTDIYEQIKMNIEWIAIALLKSLRKLPKYAEKIL